MWALQFDQDLGVIFLVRPRKFVHFGLLLSIHPMQFFAQ